MKKLTLTFLCFLLCGIAHGEDAPLSEAQQAMQKLAFLAGNWAGKGNSYDANGKASEYHDTENIWYDAKGGVLVIQANGYKGDEHFYGLHTVIYYDTEQKHYWYNPYTERGARKYACQLKQQQLLCSDPQNTFKLTFQRLANGQWNEFGERLSDTGNWYKSFETILDAVE